MSEITKERQRYIYMVSILHSSHFRRHSMDINSHIFRAYLEIIADTKHLYSISYYRGFLEI